ncbi:3-deoxy-8-phosphooctulonate synthase [candidate division KSB1 bacterium]
MRSVSVGDITIGGGRQFALIAGPCVIEGEDVVLRIAERIKNISERLSISFIFKSSFLKDNRSSATSYQGSGIDEGMRILRKVKEIFDVPVISDVHSSQDIEAVKDVLDIIQVPAFLSMQTSIVLAAGQTGKVINVKKGQFLHPLDMGNIIKKIEGTGNHNILLTERGTCFGYRSLVTDFRSLPLMRSLGYPVVFDPTHSLRNYGIPSSDKKGGSPEFVPYLSRAGTACGMDALFMEVHDDMDNAQCDAASMLPLGELEELLKILIEIDAIVKSSPYWEK